MKKKYVLFLLLLLNLNLAYGQIVSGYYCNGHCWIIVNQSNLTIYRDEVSNYRPIGSPSPWNEYVISTEANGDSYKPGRYYIGTDEYHLTLIDVPEVTQGPAPMVIGELDPCYGNSATITAWGYSSEYFYTWKRMDPYPGGWWPENPYTFSNVTSPIIIEVQAYNYNTKWCPSSEKKTIKIVPKTCNLGNCSAPSVDRTNAATLTASGYSSGIYKWYNCIGENISSSSTYNFSNIPVNQPYLVRVENSITPNCYTTEPHLVYVGWQTINYNGPIASGKTVSFLTCPPIVLKTGFHAHAGSRFRALCISPCLKSDKPDKEVDTNSIKANSPRSYANLSVYPNPTNGILNIEMDRNTNFEVIITNSVGCRLSTRINTRQIDMSSYPAGLYFVKIKTDSNEQSVKIIKQ